MTGSLPRPAWYTMNLGDRPFSVAMADYIFREQYSDAVSCFIRDQERAGLDILTDGDCRFGTEIAGGSWVSYPAYRIQGLTGYKRTERRGGAKPGDLLYEVLHLNTIP